MTSSAINLHSGDEFSVHMVYNGTTLTMTITDGVTAGDIHNKLDRQHSFDRRRQLRLRRIHRRHRRFHLQPENRKLDIRQHRHTQQQQASAPLFSPAAGTYTGTQSVTLTDATPGSTIFYTTNGSTPATTAGGSTFLFSAANPISVAATATIKALATAPGFTTSAVTSATYTISALPSRSDANNRSRHRHLHGRADRHHHRSRRRHLLHHRRFSPDAKLDEVHSRFRRQRHHHRPRHRHRNRLQQQRHRPIRHHHQLRRRHRHSRHQLRLRLHRRWPAIQRSHQAQRHAPATHRHHRAKRIRVRILDDAGQRAIVHQRLHVPAHLADRRRLHLHAFKTPASPRSVPVAAASATAPIQQPAPQASARASP